MTNSARPFAAKKFLEINGRRMAYIDEGEGAPIVFAHGNPTSSYLWRNVMPACRGLGRLIACDMIGMGDSEKLPDSGPDRYTYAEQRSFLFALWKNLGVDKEVVFVLHDAGALLGFDWTRQHPERVQGIAYMEAPVQPITFADFPDDVGSLVQGCRGKDGETLVLEKNLIVENVLPGAILGRLSEDEMAAYRAPFANAGEDRRAMLPWLREIPIEGETPEVVRVAADCGRWVAESPIPKLFINAEPGAVLTGRHREFCRTWRNQTEVTVEGIHFIQEDSPEKIGKALAAFVHSLRSFLKNGESECQCFLLSTMRGERYVNSAVPPCGSNQRPSSPPRKIAALVGCPPSANEIRESSPRISCPLVIAHPRKPPVESRGKWGSARAP